MQHLAPKDGDGVLAYEPSNVLPHLNSPSHRMLDVFLSQFVFSSVDSGVFVLLHCTELAAPVTKHGKASTCCDGEFCPSLFLVQVLPHTLGCFPPFERQLCGFVLPSVSAVSQAPHALTCFLQEPCHLEKALSFAAFGDSSFFLLPYSF